MEYTECRDPKWANAEHTAIDLYVTFEQFGELPFTAASYDHTAHGVDIFERAAAGEFGPVADFPESLLADLQAAKVAQINTACLAAIDGGFLHGGHVFDSDPRSQSNIIGTATGVSAGVPLPEGFTWRTQDNVNVPMDGPGVIALGAALLQHVSTQYAISWQLKADVEAATTPEELDAINWPA